MMKKNFCIPVEFTFTGTVNVTSNSLADAKQIVAENIFAQISQVESFSDLISDWEIDIKPNRITAK